MNIGAEEVKKATKSRGYITRVRRTSCCAAVQREKDHSDHRATALEDDFDDSDDGVSGGAIRMVCQLAENRMGHEVDRYKGGAKDMSNGRP